MSENTDQQVDQIEALFVQSAHGLTTSNGTVTFHGLAHSTLFFDEVGRQRGTDTVPTGLDFQVVS